MNTVLVQHWSGKTYTFRVPDELVPYIKKGMVLLVETKKGITTGIAKSEAIKGPGVLDVALASGAYLPLKCVIGISHEELAKVYKNEMRAAIIKLFDEESLPF